MKKFLLCASLGLLSTGLYAQVGVNTNEPKGSLDVSYTKDWDTKKPQTVYVTRVTTEQRDAWSTEELERGAMIFNTTVNCLQIFDGKIWSCMDGSNKADPRLKGVKCSNGEYPVLDRYYGDGEHDYAYCPVEVTGKDGYKRTWLNLNLGADYAKVGSSDFNININKPNTQLYNDSRLRGKLFYFRENSIINPCPIGYIIPSAIDAFKLVFSRADTPDYYGGNIINYGLPNLFIPQNKEFTNMWIYDSSGSQRATSLIFFKDKRLDVLASQIIYDDRIPIRCVKKIKY